MDDPLWRCMNSSKPINREQLELVIQKKKVSEVYSWFHDHFVKSSQSEYISRCPIVIFQGPTGCGKTSILKWISNELKAPIKEYSETTDTTAINYDLGKPSFEDEKVNLSQSIDRRKALKFEHFVINSIRFNTLYPADELSHNDADSEFDDDDGFVELISSSNTRKPPPVSGVIIHIETPLTFARSQRILIQTLCRLIKVIKDISKYLLRRVAIVFETLEGESETLFLPTKMKVSLKIQVFKFNPVIKSNMKKLVELLLKEYKHIVMDKETVEQLVNDCNGDMRACLNTLQLICNRPTSMNIPNGINNNSLKQCQINIINSLDLPLNKKQKLNHEKVRQVKLNPSLMRDNTRSLGFFHVLGKIFYQKRLYPEGGFNSNRRCSRQRSIDRPYPTENSTEYLLDLIDVNPKNLISWLHQHYYRFCHESNIEKAALFLENQSDVDVTSLNSTQSSQFYEMHHTLDQLQTYLAIESTVFSLYENQLDKIKPGQKKTLTDKGYKIIKSSVDNSTNGSELFSFTKPISMNLVKLVEDYQSLLDCCTAKLMETSSINMDRTKVLVDYVPYLRHMSDNWIAMSINLRTQCNDTTVHPIYDSEDLNKILEILENIDEKQELDFDTRHDTLSSLLADSELQC